jgi:hypothetical protein
MPVLRFMYPLFHGTSLRVSLDIGRPTRLRAVFTGLQEVFTAILRLPTLTRHSLAFYSVIEEIVEGSVEGLFNDKSSATRHTGRNDC